MEPPGKGGSSRKEAVGPSLPGSQAAAVLASLQESRETWPPGGHIPGEGEGTKETAAAAGDLIQMEGTGGGGASGRLCGEDWVTVVKGKEKRLGNSLEVKEAGRPGEQEDGRGISRLARKLREGEDTEYRKRNNVREGDWECKDPECKWRNFGWRKQYIKCQKNPNGLKTSQVHGATGGAPARESALDRARRIGERGELSRRHPKVLILTINLQI